MTPRSRSRTGFSGSRNPNLEVTVSELLSREAAQLEAAAKVAPTIENEIQGYLDRLIREANRHGRVCRASVDPDEISDSAIQLAKTKEVVRNRLVAVIRPAPSSEPQPEFQPMGVQEARKLIRSLETAAWNWGWYARAKDVPGNSPAIAVDEHMERQRLATIEARRHLVEALSQAYPVVIRPDGQVANPAAPEPEPMPPADTPAEDQKEVEPLGLPEHLVQWLAPKTRREVLTYYRHKSGARGCRKADAYLVCLRKALETVGLSDGRAFGDVCDLAALAVEFAAFVIRGTAPENLPPLRERPIVAAGAVVHRLNVRVGDAVHRVMYPTLPLVDGQDFRDIGFEALHVSAVDHERRTITVRVPEYSEPEHGTRTRRQGPEFQTFLARNFVRSESLPVDPDAAVDGASS